MASACGLRIFSNSIKYAVHYNNYFGRAIQMQMCLNDSHTLLLKSEPRRYTSFFTTINAEALWKGCTSVSNAGRKRGRGRTINKKLIKDLNKGQILGVGSSNMVWPGLNSAVIKGKELVEQKQLPPDPDRTKKLIELRDSMISRRKFKMNPLERGFSGTKMPGRSIGPPDPIGEDSFEGFDTKVLEFKTVAHMNAKYGKVRQVSCLVVTGNKNGCSGFAKHIAKEGRAALKKSKNKAGQRLLFIDRFDNHTVHHNFYAKFHKTKIFVYKKPKGFGLVCHRVIRCICEMIGITDIYAKVEGSINIQNLTKAFFLGLIKQKTLQQVANEKGLNIVEYKPENNYYPRVIAKPTICRKEEDINKNEVMDYNRYVSDGRVTLKREKVLRYYEKLPFWINRAKMLESVRNSESVKVELIAEYGDLKSFVNVREPPDVKKDDV